MVQTTSEHRKHIAENPDLFKIAKRKVLGSRCLARGLGPGAFDSTNRHLGTTFALWTSHRDKFHTFVFPEPSHPLRHAVRQTRLSEYSKTNQAWNKTKDCGTKI